MAPIYYIGKRTLFDILRTGVFWGAVVIVYFLCFAMLYWGWHATQQAQFGEDRYHGRYWRDNSGQYGSRQYGSGQYDSGQDNSDEPDSVKAVSITRPRLTWARSEMSIREPEFYGSPM